MTKPLVRKFQPPTGSAPLGASSAPGTCAASGSVKPAATPQPKEDSPPATDFDIPEINTNFIDNLFTDPTFVDRFDVAFGQTVPMGLDEGTQPSADKAKADAPGEEWPDMLDISFTKTKP